MNSFKILLTEKLAEIKEQFTEFDPSYEFHKDSDTHFVVVKPSILNSNQEFETLCGNLLLELLYQFPDDGLAFVTIDSLVQLSNTQSLFEAKLPELISFNENVVFVSASGNNFFHEKHESEDISYYVTFNSDFDSISPVNGSDLNADDENYYTMAA